LSDRTPRPPFEPFVAPDGALLFARDMTVTVAADVPLDRLQAKLAEADQWLPVDCARPTQTVGELVERYPSGPLRLGYGAWRDLLLGCQFTNGNGELITVGGRVMKNVAGYDLTKFMVGQCGTFGKLVTITARTYRRPEFSLVAEFEPRPAIISAQLPTPCRPQWAMMDRSSLQCGYLGDEPTIAYIQSRLGEWKPTKVEPPAAIARENPFVLIFEEAVEGTVFRAFLPPARILEFVESSGAKSWRADPAFGLVVGYPADESDRPAIRAAARAVGGSVTFFDRDGSPAEIDCGAGVSALLARIKHACDPQGKLRPLPRFMEWGKNQ
jgi:hypothetical protein